MPLTLEPIGYARTPLTSRVEAPRQPGAAAGCRGTIELLAGRGFEHALADLAGWDRIWVIFWFHLNAGWRPKVLPPRSTTGRKGVFATRAPHRPNPLGLSALRLERIEGLTLHVGEVDLLDGTPVLDIKPYVPYTDAHPAARSGWLGAEGQAVDSGKPADPVSAWTVGFEEPAHAQLDWIVARTGFDLRGRVIAVLSLGPEPHPYRRIRRETAGLRLAVQDWRVRFVVAGREVRVLAVESGYRPAQLAAEPLAGALQAHREFRARWPGGGAVGAAPAAIPQ
ncbi:MAG: tRNA (N6-threonylcarbamoyladenosine(37)-N6)-methyltransferase TrmO [Gammaproteobacteria bacterium]|nr:tRNA (N6-threonylcarbamoyladenosine(37)-N6)-methyltransferase TrmO [Gammaproteobacteria bacterium]